MQMKILLYKTEISLFFYSYKMNKNNKKQTWNDNKFNLKISHPYKSR